MSTRKPQNMRARLERTCRTLVSDNHAAVVNIEHETHRRPRPAERERLH
ncbi:hypothetical protein [Pseudomonas putida]|nr:hypothetical protein [Pseudomonas putida]